jgi:hypothetical protein
VSISETTDTSGAKAENVVIGVSKNYKALSEISLLFSYQEMSAVNYTTVTYVSFYLWII